MEELRSTEILDKEIEADARKKAAKIVAKAESEAKSIIEGVDDRVKKLLRKNQPYIKTNFLFWKKMRMPIFLSKKKGSLLLSTMSRFARL